MSARKLQQEMDRVFKRVGEGCASFDLIYNKLQNASNQSQKEKHEQDLKREIKKLQKLRDQIKTWIAMSEVRDKKQLLEQRRLIENDMERFKAVEREVKTKAYSKEGLMRANDPYAKEKQEAVDFVQTKIEELEQQIEELEEEQDNLQSSTKKSKRDASKQERINDIDRFVERHKWHISKMEIMVSMIENDKLAPESVMDLQEDIQYYVESNQDVDFAEDEAIYDELNLIGDDDNEIVETIVRDDTYTLEDLAQDLSKEAAKEAAQKRKDEKEKEKRDKERAKEKKEGITPVANSNSASIPSQPASSGSTMSTPLAVPTTSNLNAPPGMTPLPSASISAAPPVTGLHASSVPPGMVANTDNGIGIGRTPSPATRSQSPSTPGINPLPPPSVPAPKLSDTYRKGAHLAQGGATAPTPVPVTAQRALSQASVHSASTSASGAAAPGSSTAASTTSATTTGPNHELSAQVNLNQAAQTAAQMAQGNMTPGGRSGSVTASNSHRGSVSSSSGNLSLGELIDTKLLPPGLQDLVQCLDAAKQRLADPSASFKTTTVAKLVHNSFLNTPDAHMSDLPNYYHPQNPYPTPDYYPQDSLSTLEDPTVFREMQVDTLFYIFYYCQNTHQQYLAAKELKSRSWRFHKQFLTWFQRQEDPTVITDEYEEGTYRFFDFEGSWVQRRKTNFKFEFKYLENEI